MASDAKPVSLGDAVRRYLRRAGIRERLEQAGVIDEWATIVGPQIAGVATPESIGADGTLYVRVRTAAWMQELQLQSPMVLQQLRAAGRPVKRIAWKNG